MSDKLFLAAWYLSGITGAILMREAAQFGIVKPITGKREAFTYGTIVRGSILSLIGPFAWAGAVVFWVCALFEHHPLWTWPLLRDVAKFLRTPVVRKP